MNWELLLKYVNKETDDTETSQVESWLSEQTEHLFLLKYLQNRSNQLQQPLKDADIDEQWQHLLGRIFETEPSTKVRSIKRYRLIWATAASLLLGSISCWIYLQSLNSKSIDKEFTIQTPATTRGEAILPDGTEVFMAPNTKITYASSFGAEKRMVKLSGEAFFRVIHNTHKPFVIYTKNSLSVTVLGTSFNVYAPFNNSLTEVKVATGLVGVNENKHTQLLKAGEQMSYSSTKNQVVTSKVEFNDAAALQRETLFFDHNNADEIAEKMQRWYNIDVQVLSSARKRPKFSGEMKDTGVNDLMKALKYATGIEHQYKNAHTIILF